MEILDRGIEIELRSGLVTMIVMSKRVGEVLFSQHITFLGAHGKTVSRNDRFMVCEIKAINEVGTEMRADLST